MNVLIIEDEQKLSSYLEETLLSESFAVNKCYSFEEAESYLANPSGTPDLVILDRLLNSKDGVDKDGIDLIEPMKSHFPKSRILILSAVNTATEKAAALDRGADDYLAKPFSSVELLARLRALGRRPSSDTATVISIGNVEIDTVARLVQTPEGRIHLSNKEFLVLLTLAKTPGKVFSRNSLCEIVWEMKGDLETNVVEATITNLRRKLEQMSSGVKVRNMRNAGYWIEV